MPIDIEMLNPLGFLVRRYPIPPEIELLQNGTAFLFTLLIYVLSFAAGFHIACLSSYFAMCVYGYCIYKNLEAINAGWEKRHAEEAQVEVDDTPEDDRVKEEIPSESETELEEGEIKENRVHPPSLEVSEESDDSQDEDLPPLIPASEINWIHHVD